MIGETVSHYRIVERLGAGAMGIVYRAEDTRLGRSVAVKFLPTALSHDPDAVRRFRREARAAAALNHPNICTIHDFGEHQGQDFIVMEALTGETLEDRLQRGPLSINEAVSFGKQIADALRAAHRENIVHRDIKPSNLFVTARGEVKMLDFGIAKLMAASQTERGGLTLAGAMIGTLSYMSPEQAEGEAIDVRTDIFSLGAVLYEMLVGRRAFDGRTPVVVLAALLGQEPPAIDTQRPETPDLLRETVEKALQKNPALRFQDAEELLAALEGISTWLRRSADGAIATRLSERHVSRLPVPRSSIIGREAAVEAVRKLVIEGGGRIVTLTGPGGTGKTTLALAVAEGLQADLPDGVFWVPLSSLVDAELVLATIANALRTPGLGRADVADAVAAQISGKAILLVLDNFEHVVSAAPVLAALVSRCPRLRVLTTSRVVLMVSEEQEFPVEALDVPDPAGSNSTAIVGESPAVRLFLARAKRVMPSFSLSEENAADIAFMCQRLDGLPLAIELAAARVKVLPPSELKGRLEHSLAVLTGGARDAPQRQRTLRSTIEWSYDLLSAEHRTLFRRLSVFAPGCSLDAAESVCRGPSGDGASPAEPVIDPLEGLTALVDNSLLAPEVTRGGEQRFEMLQTIREYALERLTQSGEESALRERHARFFVSLAEEASPELHGADQAHWLNRLEREHDNLRSGFTWLADHGDADACLRLGTSLGRFWRIHGHLAEGRERLQEALSMEGAEADSITRCRALQSAGWLVRDQGEYPVSRKLFDESLSLARRIGDGFGVTWALIGLGVIDRYCGEHEQAVEHLDEALRLARSENDREALAASLGHLVAVARDRGDYSTARPLLEESLANYQAVEDSLGIAWSHNNLGLIANGQGEHDEARRQHELALDLYQAIGDRQNIAFTWNNLGMVARASSDLEGARSYHERALSELNDVGDRRGMAFVLENLAAVAAQEGRSERAVRIATAAAMLRASVSAAAPPAWEAELRTHLVVAKACLTPAEVEAAAAESRGWSMAEAVRYALKSGATSEEV